MSLLFHYPGRAYFSQIKPKLFALAENHRVEVLKVQKKSLFVPAFELIINKTHSVCTCLCQGVCPPACPSAT